MGNFLFEIIYSFQSGCEPGVADLRQNNWDLIDSWGRDLKA